MISYPKVMPKQKQKTKKQQQQKRDHCLLNVKKTLFNRRIYYVM